MGVVLVTGASGFIGGHLVARLRANGRCVRTFVRDRPRSAPSTGSTADVFIGDVRDARAVGEAMSGVDTVFHLAGKAHDLAELDDSGEHESVTLGGTDTVLQQASAHGVRRFVFFSSLAVYGNDRDRGPRNESSACQPSTPYGRAKLAAEDRVIAAGARTGMHATCLRPAMVYGAGCRGNLPRMIAMIDRGLFPPPPRVDNRRSLLHIGNLVDAALLAAGRDAANGRRYIVADARPYSTREMFDLLCAALGRRVPSWSVPAPALRALAFGGDVAGRVLGRRVGFDSDALERLLGSAWFSADGIARDLGYAPAVNFEDGVGELVTWYRRTRS